ncbi:MAG: hypothetical protein ACYC5N_01295 [Endomicrobiales bacterium]
MSEIFGQVLLFVNTYRTLIMSLSLVVLGLMVLVLWFKIYHSHHKIGGLILASGEANRSRNRRIEQLSDEMKRHSETAFSDLFRQLEEERNRINALQRMLIELKEKQYNGSRTMEKSIQAVMFQMSRRMEAFEKQAKYEQECIGEPGEPVAEEAGEKGNLLA